MALTARFHIDGMENIGTLCKTSNITVEIELVTYNCIHVYWKNLRIHRQQKVGAQGPNFDRQWPEPTQLLDSVQQIYSVYF